MDYAELYDLSVELYMKGIGFDYNNSDACYTVMAMSDDAPLHDWSHSEVNLFILTAKLTSH